jgi:hypothetical protein
VKAAQTHRPCSLVVSILATGERGLASVQWADGAYAVRLDSGEWCEAKSGELVFERSLRRKKKVTA